MPEQYTVEDLGKAFKTKYPGQYDDVLDADLGHAVKAKHPEDYSDFADSKAPPADTLLSSRQAASHSEFEANKPAFEKPGGEPFVKSVLDAPLDVGIGIEKALGLDPMHPIRSTPGAIGGLIHGLLKMGGAEGPMGQLDAVKGLVAAPARAVKAGGEAIREGNFPAAAQAVGEGYVSGKPAADIVGGLANLSKPLVAKAAAEVGKRIEMTAVKPTKPVLDTVTPNRQGQTAGDALIENIYRHNLGGTLTESLGKSDAKLDALSTKLSDALKNDTGSGVDLHKAVDAVEAHFKSPEIISRYAQKIPDIQKAIERQRSAVNLLHEAGAAPDGVADLYHANQFKRGVSEEGSWLNGAKDPELDARGMVANQLYRQLRGDIETAAGPAGPAVKQLNRQMGDILPVKDALIRRIPIAKRNEIVGLKEFIGLALGDKTGFGMSILNRSLKSPKVADWLVRASGEIKPAPEVDVPFIRDMINRDPATGQILMNPSGPFARRGNRIVFTGDPKDLSRLEELRSGPKVVDDARRDPTTGEILMPESPLPTPNLPPGYPKGQPGQGSVKAGNGGASAADLISPSSVIEPKSLSDYFSPPKGKSVPAGGEVAPKPAATPEVPAPTTIQALYSDLGKIREMPAKAKLAQSSNRELSDYVDSIRSAATKHMPDSKVLDATLTRADIAISKGDKVGAAREAENARQILRTEYGKRLAESERKKRGL